MADVLVYNGRAIITNRLIGGGTEPRYIAWGTGTTTATAADTSVEGEVSQAFSGSGSRVAGTSSRITVTQANDTYQVVGTLTAGGSGGTIGNAGLYDNITVGAAGLYVKSNFTGIVLAVGDSIAFTFKHTVT